MRTTTKVLIVVKDNIARILEEKSEECMRLIPPIQQLGLSLVDFVLLKDRPTRICGIGRRKSGRTGSKDSVELSTTNFQLLYSHFRETAMYGKNLAEVFTKSTLHKIDPEHLKPWQDNTSRIILEYLRPEGSGLRWMHVGKVWSYYGLDYICIVGALLSSVLSPSLDRVCARTLGTPVR